MNQTHTIFEVLSTLDFPDRKTVFELGAADGSDTRRIVDAIHFYSGAYYALEPEPRNLLDLKRSTCDIPNCHVLPLAVGNENRRVVFYQSSHKEHQLLHTQSGSLKRPKEHLGLYPWCEFKSEIMVQMVRLDDLASLFGIDRADFIWSDIQGADDWFLDGARSILGKTTYFYTECFAERLYEGQLNYDEMISMLPGKWETIFRWEHDVLFKRRV